MLFCPHDGGIYEAIRLKGCGNYVNGDYNGQSLRFPFPGFPVNKLNKVDLLSLEADPAAREVRGCQFPHTARRELYISEQVCRILASTKLTSGIVPIGHWEYDLGEEDSTAGVCPLVHVAYL